MLTCGGVVVAPAHAAQAEPAAQVCTVELDAEEFARATNTAHRFLEREERLSQDRYASFLAAFPELTSVETDVRRRIREEELGIYLANEHFADPSTVEYRYAVERFAELGLPEDVAAWYLSRHSPTRTNVTPPMDEIEKYHALVATKGHVPVGAKDPVWFVRTGLATDTAGIAAGLQERFPQLAAPLAQRWAEKLATTPTYANFRAVDAYAERFAAARHECEAQNLAGAPTWPLVAGIAMLLSVLGYGVFAYATFYT